MQGYGALTVSGDAGVRLNGQIILGSNTTGVVQGPLTLALLSDVNWALQVFAPLHALPELNWEPGTGVPRL